MSAIINGIKATATLLGSATTIHSSTKYLLNQVPKSGPTEFTFNIPDTAKLNEWVLAQGTAPYPSVIYLYSSDHLEQTLMAEPTGIWAKELFFSKIGRYEMIAVSNGEKITRYVDVS